MKRLLLVSLLAGCDSVTLEALTTPPPGKTASLDSENLVLDVSRGVALAFECTAITDGYSGPCRDATATVDDPTVAVVYASYSDTLTGEFGGTQGPSTRTVFVVVGLQEGKTALRVRSSESDADVAVTVEP